MSGFDEQDRRAARLIEAAAVPVPTAEETAALVSTLEREMVRVSARPEAIWLRVRSDLGVARAQLLIFPLGFWMVSASVMLAGVLLIALGLDPSRSLILYLVGPLLAYLGMGSAFSATNTRVLELELATPITPRRLAVARLVVMLGYEVVVGLLLTSALSVLAGGTLLALTSTWLMPLFLASGMTLLLSARLPVYRAATVVYALWTVIVLAGWRIHGPDVSVGVPLELALTAAGLILIGTSLLLFTPTMTTRAITEPKQA